MSERQRPEDGGRAGQQSGVFDEEREWRHNILSLVMRTELRRTTTQLVQLRTDLQIHIMLWCDTLTNTSHRRHGPAYLQKPNHIGVLELLEDLGFTNCSFPHLQTHIASTRSHHSGSGGHDEGFMTNFVSMAGRKG